MSSDLCSGCDRLITEEEAVECKGCKKKKFCQKCSRDLKEGRCEECFEKLGQRLSEVL